MLDRFFGFLPKEPPDWLMGIWTIFGAMILLGLFVQQYPHDLTGQFVYWGRLVVGLACLVIAAGLGWRRTHPS